MQLETKETKNKKPILSIFKTIFISLVISISTSLYLFSIFNIEFKLSNTFNTSLLKGLIFFANRVSEALGNSDFIILPKYEGAGVTIGIFGLCVFLVLFIITYLIEKAEKQWLLLVFIIPFFIVGIGTNLVGNPIFAIIMIMGILVSSLNFLRGNKGNAFVDFLYVGLLIGLMVSLIYIDNGKLMESTNSLDSVREEVCLGVDNIRYNKGPLSNGILYSVGDRKDDKSIAITVKMDKKDSYYLRGFVGSNLEKDKWTQPPNEMYYKNSDMFYWLNKDGFNGFEQLNNVSQLSDDNVKSRNMEIKVNNTNKGYIYMPYEISSESIEDVMDLNNINLRSKKFFGSDNYSFQTIENTTKKWPETTGEYFSMKSTKDKKEYAKNESYFNDYVYKNFTFLSSENKIAIKNELGPDLKTNEGHVGYKEAIANIQKYLDENMYYTPRVKSIEKGEDFLTYILKSKKGYDIQYATLATEMFRYYGIPARYVEGYLITPKNIEENGDADEIEITQNDAHAWPEIYVDGIGFVPIEVTPKYMNIMEQPDMTKGIETKYTTTPYEKKQQNQDEDNKTNEGIKHSKLSWKLIGIVAFSILLAMVLIFVLVKIVKKKYIYGKRRRAFRNRNNKLAVCAMYSYILEKEILVSEDCTKIGGKAAYSQMEISDEERKIVENELKNKKTNKLLVLTIVIVLAFSSCGTNGGIKTVNKDMQNTGKYIVKQVQEPTVSSVGGEWAVIGLANSKTEVPTDYFNRYYDNVSALVKKTKGNISDTPTDYSRVTLALVAIGKDPTNVQGYDISKGKNSFKVAENQGINAVAYAVIATNAAGVKLKDEDKYIDAMLNTQGSDGSYMLSDGSGKLDGTIMIIQALSSYLDQEKIDKSVDKGVSFLASKLNKDGSLGDCEKTSQAIVALVAADKFNDDISLDKLLKGLSVYALDDGYIHDEGETEINEMATEQALVALAAANGKVKK